VRCSAGGKTCSGAKIPCEFHPAIAKPIISRIFLGVARPHAASKPNWRHDDNARPPPLRRKFRHLVWIECRQRPPRARAHQQSGLKPTLVGGLRGCVRRRPASWTAATGDLEPDGARRGECQNPGPRMTAAPGTGVHALVQVARTAEPPQDNRVPAHPPIGLTVRCIGARSQPGGSRSALPQRRRCVFQGEKILRRDLPGGKHGLKTPTPAWRGGPRRRGVAKPCGNLAHKIKRRTMRRVPDITAKSRREGSGHIEPAVLRLIEGWRAKPRHPVKVPGASTQGAMDLASISNLFAMPIGLD
jgi:hypothetical protein